MGKPTMRQSSDDSCCIAASAASGSPFKSSASPMLWYAPMRSGLKISVVRYDAMDSS